VEAINDWMSQGENKIEGNDNDKMFTDIEEEIKNISVVIDGIMEKNLMGRVL
jgi:hypothetical protein